MGSQNEGSVEAVEQAKEPVVKVRAIKKGYIRSKPGDPRGCVVVQPGEVLEVPISQFSDHKKKIRNVGTGWMEPLEALPEWPPRKSAAAEVPMPSHPVVLTSGSAVEATLAKPEEPVKRGPGRPPGSRNST